MAAFTCKGCTDRYVGCHGKCEKYIAEKQKSEEARLRQLKSKLSEGDFINYRRQTFKNMANKRRRER